MKIDAHQHFWHYSPAEYGWIGEGMEALARDFLPADLWTEQGPLGFDGSIAVQARQSLAETVWLLQLADANPRLLGVVGWLDLCSPELPAQLERFGAHPKLRGLRHVLQDEPDDAFMLRDDFSRGLARLREHGLTYDLLLYPRHLPIACELVARFPEQRFVLDHLAKPFIKDTMLEPWASDLRSLARFPNVSCKLSGMVTEADWRQWRPEDLRPYLETALEAFGPERLMIGSDWPVCTLAGDYATVMGAAMAFIAPLTPREQGLILAGAAARSYGVDA